jgi:hypothetical protein
LFTKGSALFGCVLETVGKLPDQPADAAAAAGIQQAHAAAKTAQVGECWMLDALIIASF